MSSLRAATGRCHVRQLRVSSLAVCAMSMTCAPSPSSNVTAAWHHGAGCSLLSLIVLGLGACMLAGSGSGSGVGGRVRGQGQGQGESQCQGHPAGQSPASGLQSRSPGIVWLASAEGHDDHGHGVVDRLVHGVHVAVGEQSTRGGMAQQVVARQPRHDV